MIVKKNNFLFGFSVYSDEGKILTKPLFTEEEAIKEMKKMKAKADAERNEKIEKMDALKKSVNGNKKRTK